jgi:predicted GTPase
VTVFVVANKVDQQATAVVEEEKAVEFAEMHNAAFLKVSAVTGDGVRELFEAVAERLEKGTDIQIEKSGPTAREGDGCGC